MTCAGKNAKETSLFVREIQPKPEVRSRVAARVWNSNARETEEGEWPARNKQTKPKDFLIYLQFLQYLQQQI